MAGVWLARGGPKRITEFRVRRTDLGGRWQRLSERGQAPSRERDEARPQQARLGWHAVPTLPEASEATRTARGAVPTRGRRGS